MSDPIELTEDNDSIDLQKLTLNNSSTQTQSINNDASDVNVNSTDHNISSDSNTIYSIHSQSYTPHTPYNNTQHPPITATQRRSRKPEFTTRLVVAENKPKYFSLPASTNDIPSNPDIRILLQRGREFYINECRDPNYINTIAEQGWNSRLNVNEQPSTHVSTSDYLRKHSRAPLSPFLAAMHGYDVPAELYMSDKQRKQYYIQLQQAGVDINSLQQQTQQYHDALYKSQLSGADVDPMLHFSYWRTVDENQLIAEQAGLDQSQKKSKSSKTVKVKRRENGWNDRFIVEKALDSKATTNNNNQMNHTHPHKSYLQHYLQNTTSINHKNKSKNSSLINAGMRRTSQQSPNNTIKYFDQQIEQKSTET